ERSREPDLRGARAVGRWRRGAGAGARAARREEYADYRDGETFHVVRHSFVLEELPREVEAEEQRIGEPARARLRERRELAVREIELEDMRARALLDGEAILGRVGRQAGDTRRDFRRDVDGGPDADTPAEADIKRVVCAAGDLTDARRDAGDP